MGDAPASEYSAPVRTNCSAGLRTGSAAGLASRADGKRIEVRNRIRPKMEAIQLSGSARGRRTRAAPRIPRNKRNTNQERGFRRRLELREAVSDGLRERSYISCDSMLAGNAELGAGKREASPLATI